MLEEIKKPEVEPGEWISVGQDVVPISAVVCRVYDNDPLGGDLEVVYLDGSRAINEDVIWNKNYWRFKNSGPSGGYADNYSRLSEFVQILRAGRRYH